MIVLFIIPISIVVIFVLVQISKLFSGKPKRVNKVTAYEKRPIQEDNNKEEVNNDNMFEERPIQIYKKKYFFTKNENIFYRSLKEALKDENVIVLSKVRVIDIIDIPNRQKNFIYYFNRLKAKHIDFVICDKDYFQPIFCIELDDQSHLREDRIERDILINKVFEKVNMPLIRMKAQKEYTVSEIKELLNLQKSTITSI